MPGLFDELKIRDLIIPNRIWLSPMCQYSAIDGLPNTWHTVHLGKYAMGKVGLIMTEASGISPSARSTLHDTGIWNDEQVDAWRTIVDFVHLQGVKIGIQLWHAGQKSSTTTPWQGQDYVDANSGGWQAVAPSEIAFGKLPKPRSLTEEEIHSIIDQYRQAATRSLKAGFDVVEIHGAHGYLIHSFLSPITNHRKDQYGGSFENRTRFFRNIVEGIQKNAPGLEIGVRLSSFDFVPFKKGADDIGIAELDETGKYKYAFGGDGSGLNIDLTETKAFLQLAEGLGIQLICISAASPYYNPHLMRPAIFPPSDGYSPPEEPLAGVARMINITAELKNAFPNLFIVGSGYTYLQDWLPNVGQYVLRNQMADFIGLGRMVLSYPTMPDDIINGRPLERKQICRTFSDCTTAPRNGIISGCYPLDLFYKNLPQAEQLKETKKLL